MELANGAKDYYGMRKETSKRETQRLSRTELFNFTLI
jgi:hypothetical protein